MAPWNHAPAIPASVDGPGCWLRVGDGPEQSFAACLSCLDQPVEVQTEVLRSRGLAVHFDDESPELAVGPRQEHAIKSTMVTITKGTVRELQRTGSWRWRPDRGAARAEVLDDSQAGLLPPFRLILAIPHTGGCR